MAKDDKETKKEESPKDKFLGPMKEFQNIRRIPGETEDGRSDVEKKAKEEFYKTAYGYLKQVGARIVDPSFPEAVKGPEELAQQKYAEIAQQAFKGAADLVEDKASKAFADNLEGIVAGASEKVLDKLARTQEIVSRAGDSYESVLQTYLEVASARKIAEKASKKEDLTNEERRPLIELVAERAAKQIKAKLEEKKYSKPSQETAANIERMAVYQNNAIKKEEFFEVAKDFLTKVKEKNPKYDSAVRTAVTGVLKKMVGEKGPDFKTARELVYGAHKDEYKAAA